MATNYKLILIFIMVGVLQLVSVSTVFAATYYVDKDNVGAACNNTHSGLREGLPFCSIEKAHSVIQPGDTVLIRTGTYPPFTVSKSGIEGKPITFSAYGQEKVTIDGTGSGVFGSGIALDRTRYVQIRNFEVMKAEGDYRGGIYIRGSAVPGGDYTATLSSHNTVIGNKVHDNSFGTRWVYGIYVVNSSYNVIEANEVYNNRIVGIAVEGNENVPTVGNKILSNTVHHNSGFPEHSDGIQVSGTKTTGTLIAQNTIFQNADDGVDLWNSQKNTVEKNLIYDHKGPGNGNGIKAGGVAPGGDNIIRYNIAYGNSANGFDSNGSGGNKFYNNVAYNNGLYGFEDGWRYENATGCYPRTERCAGTLKNNIGLNNGKANLSANEFTKVSDYNLWYSSTSGAKVSYDYVVYPTLQQFSTASGMNLDQHSISSDPLFTSLQAHDFTLQNTSLAKNAGVNVGATADFKNTPVPHGSSPEIGAYELIETDSITHCAEDINQDGIVNVFDFSILSRNFFKTVIDPAGADINKDGAVNVLDFSLLSAKFFKSC